jgi:hypothetical protein
MESSFLIREERDYHAAPQIDILQKQDEGSRLAHSLEVGGEDQNAEGDGFNNDSAGACYNEAASKLAMERTIACFNKY